jgi:hypothetical protein
MRSIRLLMALGLLALTGCAPGTGPLSQATIAPQTLAIHESANDPAQVQQVLLEMGQAELNLAPGAGALLEGTVTYNYPELKPNVVHNGNLLEIRQGPFNGFHPMGVLNRWALKLGNDPLELQINAGAYKATMDLGGLPLRRLTIHDGASDVKLTFGAPNPAEMSRMQYDTGASSVQLTGLANANFALLDFSGGAGDYLLDFSGELRRDADAEIHVGVSNTELRFPKGTPAVVNVEGGLKDVSLIGDWQVDGDRYTRAGRGPRLSVHVTAGAGHVTLNASGEDGGTEPAPTVPFS